MNIKIKTIKNLNVFISGGKDFENIDKNYQKGAPLKSTLDVQNTPHSFNVDKSSKIFIFVLPEENKNDLLEAFKPQIITAQQRTILKNKGLKEFLKGKFANSQFKHFLKEQNV